MRENILTKIMSVGKASYVFDKALETYLVSDVINILTFEM